jgi:hypothetical protein
MTEVTIYHNPDCGTSRNTLAGVGSSTHAPRILLLYGALRTRSFSRLLTFDDERVDEDEVVGGRVEDGHLKSSVAWRAQAAVSSAPYER